MKKSAQELYSSLWLPIGHGNFRMSRILFLVMISGKHFCSSLFKFYLVYLGDLGQPLNPLHLPLQVLSCLSRWSWTTSQPSAPPSSSSILFISVILDNLSTLCSSLFKFYLVYLGDLGQPLNPLQSFGNVREERVLCIGVMIVIGLQEVENKKLIFSKKTYQFFQVLWGFKKSI